VLVARPAVAAGRVAVTVLDLDAHCGGGTASLIQDDPRVGQIDVSVNAYDSYSGSERVWLEVVQESADYLPAVRRGLDEADRQRFGLCLYNAGMAPQAGTSTVLQSS